MTTIYCLCFVFSSTGPLSARAQAPFKGKSKEWLKIGKEQRGNYFLSEVYFCLLNAIKILHWIFLIYLDIFLCSRATSMERLSSSSSTLSSRSPGHKLCIYVNSGWVIIFVLSLTKTMHLCHWVIESLSFFKFFLSLPFFLWTPFFNCLKNKFITINPQQQAAGVLKGVFLTGPPLNLLRVGR